MKTLDLVAIREELLEAESIIQGGLKSFRRVGEALRLIRDSRLYREGYATFEEYCQTRWGFSRSRAHRLIEATDTVDELLPMGNIDELPASERQARALSDCSDDNETRSQVWAAAVEESKATGEKITAKKITEKAKRIAKPEVIEMVKEGSTSGESKPRKSNSNAIQFALEAIALLRRIAVNDECRESAFNMVRDFMDNN